MTNRQRDHAGLYHAAELGDADAQYNLGTLYFVGQDVPQDYTEAAVRWLRRAAEQGNQFLNATDGRLLSGEKCTGAAVGPRLYEDRKGQFKVGYTKRLMELRESQMAEAATIAVEAGVLRRCELHPEITIQFADPSPAYKIANARFTANELENEYASRRELTDAIQTAIEDALIDGCPLCERLLAD